MFNYCTGYELPKNVKIVFFTVKTKAKSNFLILDYILYQNCNLTNQIIRTISIRTIMPPTQKSTYYGFYWVNINYVWAHEPHIHINVTI